MKKYLFIAEKPSLMREVQSCYQKNKSKIVSAVGEIIFTALAGHVCVYSDPNTYDDWNVPWDHVDYPMIPTVWKIKSISNKNNIIDSIKKLYTQCDGIIVGTDSDQEGYGIYYLLEKYLHLENVESLRFIEHSLTEEEILESLLHMTDIHKDPVHIRYTQSYLLRAQADWLFGMNLTRMMSFKVNELQNIGRVKSPTIKLVYDNSMAIEKFKPEKYYIAVNDYGNNFFATLINEEGSPIRFKEPTAIPVIPQKGIVSKIIKKEKKTPSPKLYDLSALQGDAVRLDMVPSETLDVLQDLYEKHKIVSYPRTQCRYVSSEKAKEFPVLLRNAAAFPELKPFINLITSQDIKRVSKDKRIVNDKEIAKESHDALLPTSKMPDISKLNDKEYQLCLLTYKRFVAQFLPALTESLTKIYITHGNHIYMASGKTISGMGWRELYGELKDLCLPNLKEKDSVLAKKSGPVEKTTTPPKRLNQATLLTAMTNIANLIEDEALKKSLAESKGIGTPATRATIISSLIKDGYIIEKKGLYISEKGKKYIDNLKDIDIISPIFAAVMDTEIKQVQRGEENFNDAYNGIIKKLHDVCIQINQIPDQKNLSKFEKETTMKCPKCRTNLTINDFVAKCPNEDFIIYRNICNKSHKLTQKEIKLLLSGKTTEKIELKNKEGRSFKASLYLDKDYKVKFKF